MTTKIREGYKQTEVGVIPEDWEVKTLGSVSIDMLQGVNTAIDIPKYVEDGIPMLKANNIIDREVNFETADHVAIKTYHKYSDRYKLQLNDFLFSNIGARLGTGSLLNNETECTFAWNVMRITPNQKIIDPSFLGHLMNSKIVFFQITNNITGSGMGFVPKNILKKMLLPLPSKSTQTAISTALSDADALITSLEKLIEKKRAIKQGAMQELLKPKEGWEVKKLGEIADILTGFPFSSSGYSKSGVRLLRGSNIKRGQTDWNEDISQYWPKITTELFRYQLNCGDIVVAMDGSLVGKSFAQLSQVDLPAILLQRVARIRSIHIDINYLKELICSEIFTGYCDSVKTSSAIPHISPADIYNYNISYPLEKSEQTRIATILSDMDAEINALEQKLGKYKLIKQGMMQELLTGRIRLVENV